MLRRLARETYREALEEERSHPLARRTNEYWDDPAGNTFRWSRPTRADGFGFRPAYEQELTIGEIKGTFNNVDFYVNGWLNWNTAFGAGPVLFSIYALVGNTPHPILTGIDATTQPSYVVNADTSWHVYIGGVRGRVCDGFRLTARLGRATVPTVLQLFQGQASGFAWGTETAEADTITVTLAPNQPVNATIVAPLPLPVLEAPASAWAQIAGTAPDGSGGVTVATALGASVATRSIAVSAAKANPAGSIIYVKAAAGNLASASGAELGPGDTATIEVDNGSKIFVLGSAAGLKWLAAVV